VGWGGGGADEVARRVAKWEAVGASHVTLNTMGAGFTSVDAHVEALTAAAAVLELAPVTGAFR
jgi:hypothetical protein